MCWIFAYNGDKNSVPLLVAWLKDLEYRGYDSAGLIGLSASGDVFFKKAVGRVSSLATKVDADENSKWEYSTGIAHTRWATHGIVNEENTHPHTSANERFYVVHNGIIENFKELKAKLEEKYTFYSQTDTEVIAKLIEESFDGDLRSTLEEMMKVMVGAYSIAVMDKENPGTIVWIKLGSPMIIWEADDGIYISSDVNALSKVAQSYVTLEDYEMVVVKDKTYKIYSAGEMISKDAQEMDIEYDTGDMGNFSSFTEKEIFEIPEVLENVFNGRINFEDKSIHNETLSELNEHDIQRIEIIASGSSYYAGLIGSYWFRDLAGIPVGVTISSEFLSDTFLPDDKALYVFLSQSGETADVRESLKIVKAKWCLTFGIVNVVGSTIARLADMWLYSHAWVEVWVASTKNVIAQVGIMLLMSMSMWLARDLQYSKARAIIDELGGLGDKIHEVLISTSHIHEVAKKYTQYSDMFVLGRNIFYPTAGEISLKCKELSYIHTENYSAGELKHGPLALIDPELPCLFVNPAGKHYVKTVSNIEEVRARSWVVLGFISKWDPRKDDLYTDTIELPDTSETMAPFTSLIAGYIFALYLAQELDRDVDKPKNLAKSVTVE